MSSSLSEISKARIPEHIAIIMDGNGRWAKKQMKERSFGHRAGVEAIENAINACKNIGTKYLTVYAFSTENWKRPKTEVTILMKLLVEYLKKETSRLHSKGIRLNALGDIAKLPEFARKELVKSMEQTKDNDELVLSLALSYGSRNDIKDALVKILGDYEEGKIKKSDIDEFFMGRYLTTNELPDPDLLIRTGGEKRLSNFLLWESAYTEFYFTDIFWPDFKEESLYEAVLDYQDRERRFGGLK